MPFEKQPAKVVPTSYVPPGTRHPVKTGESWVSLAQPLGIDPWDLIDFNFPGTKKVKQTDFQLATRYVNWYLREYVGCQIPTKDGRNWTFTSGLNRGKGAWKGGFIYLPLLKTAPPPPSPPPSPSPLWPTEPLPEDRKDRFREALDALEQKVSAKKDPRNKRYLCWISKLRAGGDDRVVRWHKIYPTVFPPLVVGSRDITAGTPVGQEAIEAAVKSVQDVEVAGRKLGFIVHMRSQILFTREMTSESGHLENFRRFHDDVIQAIEKLDKWANIGHGGSSAMPKAYVSIKDWIGRQQRDSKSVYACL